MFANSAIVVFGALRVNMVLSLTEFYHSVMRTAIMQIGNYNLSFISIIEP